MNSLLISIIIPVYNVEEYLENCVESIIKQTYRNIEVILINDGSLDKSGEICNNLAKVDSRIRVVHQENKGVSYTRNFGINLAKGDYLLFVDSDDRCDILMVETLTSLINLYSADIVICGYDSIENKRKYKNEISKLTSYSALNKLCTDDIIGGFIWNKIYKKNLFDTVKFDETKLIGEDFLVNYQIFQLTENIVYVDKPLYFYEIRKNSATTKDVVTTSLNLVSIYEELYCNYKKTENNFLNIELLLRRVIKSYLSLIFNSKGKFEKELYEKVQKKLRFYCYSGLKNKCMDFRGKSFLLFFSINLKFSFFIYKNIRKIYQGLITI